jgi:hypothetical protein
MNAHCIALNGESFQMAQFTPFSEPTRTLLTLDTTVDIYGRRIVYITYPRLHQNIMDVIIDTQCTATLFDVICVVDWSVVVYGCFDRTESDGR